VWDTFELSADEFIDGSWIVRVSDDGRARVRKGETSGFGLIGAAERVHALEGEFSAASRPAGGFEVLARIPAVTTQSAESETGVAP